MRLEKKNKRKDMAFKVTDWTSKQLKTFITKNEPSAQISHLIKADLVAIAQEFVPKKSFTIVALHKWLATNGLKFDPAYKPQKEYLLKLIENYVPPTVTRASRSKAKNEDDHKHGNNNETSIYTMNVRDMCSFLLKHKEKGMLKAVEAILQYTDETYQLQG